MPATTPKTPKWILARGKFASYTGKTSPLLRGGRRVRIVAEARGKRTVVEAIGYEGHPVQFTVATANLGQPQPDLFDTE